jgi:L-ascorbate metabolism protein UlaG (beta-lactamase superfamily)
MTIKKIAHSCIVVEEGNTRILIDPGLWSLDAKLESDIDAIVVTHQHKDHFDLETVLDLLQNNKECSIYANQEIIDRYGKELTDYIVIKNGDTFSIKGVTIEVYGEEHAFIRDGVPRIINNGLFINKRLYVPGDAYFVPPVTVDILALPVAAPWGKISEAIDYLKAVKPKIIFPIHDGMQKIYGPYHEHPKAVAEVMGISFIELLPGDMTRV